jgi:hypothetical protein
MNKEWYRNRVSIRDMDRISIRVMNRVMFESGFRDILSDKAVLLV